MKAKLPSIHTGDRLSPTRCKILALVCDAVSQGRRPPTLRELSTGVGIYHSAVRGHLLRLKALGLVDFEENRPGTLHPVCTFALAKEAS